MHSYKAIQIHLMLLLIKLGLSIPEMESIIQIHLMLLLILMLFTAIKICLVIQIHLMLLLIPLKINYLCFNNIKKILKYQASF